MNKRFSHSDYPSYHFVAYDGPAKNAHLFGLPFEWPSDIPIEVVVVVFDASGSERGEWHMLFDNKFTDISHQS